MTLTVAIDPTRESIKRFAEEFPAGQPVVMLNLLRFREQAAYAARLRAALAAPPEASGG